MEREPLRTGTTAAENRYYHLQGELYLGRLLNGEYNSELEATQAPEGCGFSLMGSHFVVLNLVVNNITSDWFSASLDSFASLRNTIIPQIESTFFGFLEGLFDNYYCVIDNAMNIVICIQPTDMAMGGTALLGQIVQKTKERLQSLEESGIYLIASISNLCPGLLGLKTAYQQIKELENHRRILGDQEQILQYSILDQPLEVVSSLPLVERKELDCYLDYFQAIRLKDYGLAQKSFLELLDEVFYRVPPPPRLADNVYRTFIHMMFLSINEIRKSADDDVEQMIRPEKLLPDDCSVGEMKENFMQAFDFLKDHRSGNEKQLLPAWYQGLLRYIEDNYADMSLNVSSLAERFSLKPAYLSRAFKEYSEMRLLDYINLIRVRAAKKRILSGITVAQAAAETGFGSVLTMRRAFLKFEGTLPSKI
jgi:AraC-like DNA-binding protein